jgi:hypothetical protein
MRALAAQSVVGCGRVTRLIGPTGDYLAGSVSQHPLSGCGVAFTVRGAVVQCLACRTTVLDMVKPTSLHCTP